MRSGDKEYADWKSAVLRAECPRYGTRYGMRYEM
jgi:hypothetical protein